MSIRVFELARSRNPNRDPQTTFENKGVLPERFRAFVEFHLHGKKGIIEDETIPVAKVKQR